jgi:hypothetical protein
MGHELRQNDGSVNKISCDKTRLGTVIQQMISDALDRHLKAGEIFEYRHLLTISGMMLQGLPAEAPTWHSSLDEFLQKYRFDSHTDNTKCPATSKTMGGIIGLTPLFYAAAAGALQVVIKLLAQPGVINFINAKSKVEIRPRSYGLVFYGTPLLGAGHFSGSIPMLELLWKHGADPNARTVGGTALHGFSLLQLLACNNHVDAIEWLRGQHSKDGWVSKTEEAVNQGGVAMSFALLCDSPPAFKMLLSTGANPVNKEPSGLTFMTYAARSGT